jgi:hypothetical protein
MIHKLGGKIKSWGVRPETRWCAGLAAFGFLERVWLWQVYQSVAYGDTGSYMRLAGVVSRLTLDGYDGTRVPGYPAFLALVGMEADRVWFSQMVLGWMISLLLFWLGWRTTGSPFAGALIGGLYNVIPGQVLFEANLLTETLTTFWIVLSLTLFVALDRERSLVGGSGWALALGVAASAVGMVRPLFFPLTIWYLLFVLLTKGVSWRNRLVRLAAYSIGPLLIQGGWLLYMNTSYHMLSPTAMAGYSLVQHTGEFFEYLPDDVAPIRDTYLKFRDAQIEERGVQTNVIWDAIPAMTEASGLNFYKLSREMRRLSIQLIREHPDLYIRNVIEGWVAFWKAPVYWQKDAVSSQFVSAVLEVLASLGRMISVAANFAFLALSSLLALSRRARVRFGFDRLALTAGGMVWLISIMQTILDHGDNPRFLVPLQMVVIYVVVRSIRFWLSGRGEAEAVRL